MSENTNRRDQDFARYDAMSTGELEEILRLDLDAPQEQESDTEVLLYIMAVLAQRKKPSENKAVEALDSFRRNYMPEEEQTATVFNCRKKTYSRTPTRRLRALAATAAVVVLIWLSTATAQAFGLDVWNVIAKWTEDTFHISIDNFSDTNEPSTQDNLPYASLEEMLQKKKVDVLLAPTWIPEGYTLTELTSEETPLNKTYRATYQNESILLKINIQEYLQTDPKFVEQSDALVETYEVSGITYYLFSNNSKTQAVWINGSFECQILGKLTIIELKTMIDSIEKG